MACVPKDHEQYDMLAEATSASQNEGAKPKGLLAKECWNFFVNVCRVIGYVCQNPKARDGTSRSQLRRLLLAMTLEDLVARVEKLIEVELQVAYDDKSHVLLTPEKPRHDRRN